jgi:hypothetical protein
MKVLIHMQRSVRVQTTVLVQITCRMGVQPPAKPLARKIRVPSFSNLKVALRVFVCICVSAPFGAALAPASSSPWP